MFEALIVLGLVGLLVALGTIASVVSWTTLVLIGSAAMALGFVVGVPAGAYYHVVLHRYLHPRGLLEGGWYWAPVKHHKHLEPGERAHVMRWFYTGGTGFMVIVVGVVLTSLGLLLAP
jgi:hypothetical protein